VRGQLRLLALQSVRLIVRLAAMSTDNRETAAITLAALHAWHTGVANAFAHVAEADFALQLASALTRLVPLESIIISHERQGRPPLLLHQQGVPEQYRDTIINRYFTCDYLLDPFCLAVENGLAEGFYPLAEIAPDDFFSSEYYKNYYLKTNCGEDSYYIVDLPDHSKITVCMYHGLSAGSFTQEQLGLLRSVEPMVRALVGRFAHEGLHSASTGVVLSGIESQPLPSINQQVAAAFINFGSAVLSEREREAAHLILRGHSVKSAARVLGLSAETVRMHRKNLYAKLGINSQSELFALFIEGLTLSVAID